MSIPLGLPGLDRPTFRSRHLDQVRAELAPLLDRIATGTLQRELDGELPFEPVRWLKEAGYGALRVPTEYGGRGLSIPELTQTWVELAAADANLAQAFRGHFALAEDRLWQHGRAADQRGWFARFVAGEIAGNAWSEVGSTAIDTQRTVLTRDPGDPSAYLLDGTKYYTTGSIFAEWADVLVRLAPSDPHSAGEDHDLAIAIVDTRAAGVTVVDDWDGFGQKGTGSGTTAFAGVRVDPDHVLPFEDRFPFQTALYQLNLLATLVGIGRAAVAETVAQVRARERNYSHANAARVRDDPQVLARVGEIASRVYVAEAATLRVAAAIQDVADAVREDEPRILRLNEEAEIEASAAQVVVTDLVLQATSDLFDTLGASATARTRGLDRHWRNARTVSSHNPRIFKARVVGEYVVNGTPPPYAWGVGATRRGQKLPQ